MIYHLENFMVKPGSISYAHRADVNAPGKARILKPEALNELEGYGVVSTQPCEGRPLEGHHETLGSESGSIQDQDD